MKNQKNFFKEEVKLTDEEEKALVGILYNNIVFGTTMEIFGELTDEGVARIDILRSAFSKLLKKYQLDNKLSQETFVVLGLKEFIETKVLSKFIADDGNKHMQNRAKYFLAKLQ